MDLSLLLDKWKQVLSEHNWQWKVLATVGCILVATIYGPKWNRKRRFLKKVKQERERRAKSVQFMEGKVTKFKKQGSGADCRRILNMSLPELVKELHDGSVPVESVLYSYVNKALELDKDLNCVTVFLTDCEAQIEELKRIKTKGPLYGVPISIKEHIGYKGHPSTCGLAQYIDELETEDSVLVKVLKKQGAIVFAKTNVPQTLICYESSNPIYGLTCNPHNQSKGSAGSTGGEGALIGGGGSVLGFGTDLGGSIRLPSSFCGITGFKPTPNRLSTLGIRPCIDGLRSVLLCVGPMARDVDSLVLCMKAVLCDEMFKLDPTVPPLPFNDKVYTESKPLRVGYYETDGFTLPNPGMRRAVLEIKSLLEAAGHTLVPFTPPRLDYVKYELFLKAMLGDGGKTLKEKLDQNICDPNLKDLNIVVSTPGFLKKLLSFVLWPLYPRISKFINATRGASSVKDHWHHQTALQEYQTEFIAEWRKLDLDVILCPMLGPAFNIGYAKSLLVAISTTMLYNVLQFPAGVVTVTSVTEEDEAELKNYKGHYNDPFDRLFKEAVSGGVGLPLSVQCAALPYQDELCLRFMKEVETLNRAHKNIK
ncbi:vitamin D3 hydroxylase-associated protein-like [Pelobates fuscus]|uniref:vitamin D3 hydroxylase-associated protein-like n=1 Tax=Pelobates fuscus TaxID=191477 RepID=UPI002FE47196